MKDAARELARVAERMRGEMRERERHGRDADFLRRNIDTLRIARKALEEGERRDAAEVIGRAIHAWELAIEGKEGALREAPGDGDMAELLTLAAALWREFKAPDRAERVQELAGFFARRARERDEGRGRREAKPGPEDRIEQLEARLDRLENRIGELLRRLEEQQDR
jgi:hypothetical protein